MLAIHAKRITIMPKDLQLARRIRGERGWIRVCHRRREKRASVTVSDFGTDISYIDVLMSAWTSVHTPWWFELVWERRHPNVHKIINVAW
jgi:hypothetical protein